MTKTRSHLDAGTITGVLMATLAAGIMGWTSSALHQPELKSGVSVIFGNLNSYVDVAVGQISANESIGQTFRATQSNMSRVDIRLATYGRTNEAPVILTLTGYPSGAPVRVVVAAPGDFQDGRYHTFRFPPVRESAGREFLMTLESPEATPGNPLSSWAGNCDCYPGGVAVLNGEPQHQLDLTIRIGYWNQTAAVTRELIGRLSQYKPGFFKGGALVILAVLALGLVIVVVGYFTFSLMHDESPSS